MRKLIASFLAVIFSLALYATPLDQDQLDRINAYIADTIADQGAFFDADVTLNDVRVDQATGLPRSATLRAAALGGLFTASAGVTLEDNIVQVQLGVEGYPAALGLGRDMIDGLLLEVQNFADRINEQGDYFASLSLQTTRTGTQARVVVEPVGPNADPAFRSLVIDGVVPANFDEEATTLSVVAEFNAEDEVVVAVQTALGNIINDLSEGMEPNQADLDVLGDLIGELVGSWL